MKMEDIIKQKLNEAFSPAHLVVENESHRHAGHAGSPGTGESHFRVEIASHLLGGVPRVEAHRRVNECLRDELQAKIHALSIKILPQRTT